MITNFIVKRNSVKESEQRQSQQYDGQWIEQQILSNINDEAFFKILDGLEDRGVISRARSREMVKEYAEIKRKFDEGNIKRA